MDITDDLHKAGTSLPKEIQKIFENPDNGTLDNISKSGCTALASLGANAWNAWRKLYPTKPYGHFSYENTADFSGCDFSKIYRKNGFPLDFSQFNFGDGANFSSTIIPRYTSFDSASFGKSADFSKSTIGDRVRFKHARFADNAKFESTNFEDWIDFDYTTFLKSVVFESCHFGAAVRFNGVRFGSTTQFTNCTFGDGACFEYIEHKEENKSWKPYEPASDSFNSICFEDCTFLGSISFENREFKGATSFARSTFSNSPNFFGCKLHPNTSFDDAIFPPPGKSKDASRVYRFLKQALAQQQATREEQRFFRLEGVMHFLQWPRTLRPWAA